MKEINNFMFIKQIKEKENSSVDKEMKNLRIYNFFYLPD